LTANLGRLLLRSAEQMRCGTRPQPNLEAHDKVVVKGFLNLFQNHIPETFSLFDESTINSNNKARPEYILAMAATGGLFCSVPGSAQITKSMYNDARRLTLASVRLSFRK
jgi:hypothetical protein